jgi:hypothetical protein
VVFLSENTAHALSKFIFKYIFHLLSRHDKSISFCLMDGHTFSGAIICMKFNGFQTFLRKRREKVLFMTSQCTQVRNNLRFFVLAYLAFISLSCDTNQAFIKAHFRPRKILGLFMYTTVPCSFVSAKKSSNYNSNCCSMLFNCKKKPKNYQSCLKTGKHLSSYIFFLNHVNLWNLWQSFSFYTILCLA